MARGRDIDQIITQLAAPTLSVVHARDLRAAGVNRNAVAGRVTGGLMAPVVGRSYAVGPACGDPSFEMLCMAGVLAGGDGSWIDGETGASLLGLWNRRVTTIHVTVPGRAVSSTHPLVRFHRSMAEPWTPDSGLRAGPIFVGNMEQLACSFANRGTPWQVAHVIDNGIHKDLGTLASLEDVMNERARTPGNATLRAAILLVAARSSGTRSTSEDASLGDLIMSGVPVPIVNTRGSMGLSRDEPDFVWPALRCNIEIDGRHHDMEPQLTDDRIRDLEAAELGWRVLRIAARDFWRRRRDVVREARRFLEGGPVPLVPGTRRLFVR